MLEQAKLGIAPLTWSNDDKPEIGKENTFKQCISEMSLAGYGGCEIGSKFPKDLETLQYELKLRNLKIANQWFSFETTLKDVNEIRPDFLKHIKFLKALGTDIVGGGEFGSSIVAQEQTPVIGDDKEHRTILNNDEWKTFTSRIEELGKIAYEEGMTLCFHHHMGTCVQTLEETERLLDACDEKYVSLNYDSGHFCFAGEDSIKALDAVKTRVQHVHLKNIRPQVLEKVKAEKMSFLDAVLAGVFTIPGDAGMIDFLPIFKLLEEVGYKNWLIVEAEQDPAKANPLQTAQISRAYLKNVLGH